MLSQWRSLANGTHQEKRPDPVKKAAYQAHPKTPYFATGYKNPGHQHAQVLRSADGSRALLERKCQLWAPKRVEMGNTIEQTGETVKWCHS